MAEQHIEELRERVAKGIEWLTANDPDGAFHLWYTAGILPTSPKPAQPDERKQAYVEYHRQRGRWEQLSRALGKIDKDWGPD